MTVNVPRYIVWSTDNIDLTDPFQRRWLLKQILTHGRAEDIRALDLQVVKRELDSLDLPPNLYSLWKRFLESQYAR
ncbi:MAG: hypothetical protein Q7U34_13595 [Anaerolineales bacterium]|nr:hypothetical protein [Anaerolineales bacterium]